MLKEYFKIAAWSLLLLTIVVSSCWISKANAQPFIEIGVAQYHSLSENIWHQDYAGYPTKFELRAPAIRGGITGKHWRVGIFDLGNYYTKAEASQNENCVAIRRDMSCPGLTDIYWTKGKIRGFSFTGILPLGNFEFELGPIYYEQDFQLHKSDGFSMYHKLSGWGVMGGIGYKINSWHIALQGYGGSVGNHFTNGDSIGDSPAGTTSVIALMIRYTF